MNRFLRRPLGTEDLPEGLDSRLRRIEDALGALSTAVAKLQNDSENAEAPVVAAPPPGVEFLDDLADVNLNNPASGEALVYNGTDWANQNYVQDDFGFGGAPGTNQRLYVTDDVGGGALQKFYFTTEQTANSTQRGLHLQKDDATTTPLGVTLEHDTGPLWDTATVDGTTTDLVLAYSHADNVKAQNIRMRQNTAQMNIGRSVAQPSLSGSQITLAAGEGATVTNITKANPAVVTTSAAHRFAVGETVQFAGVGGMVEINFTNTPAPPTITVTARTSTTLTLDLDTSGGGYTAYTAGGEVFVLMNALRLQFWGNSNGLAIFQQLSSSVSKRVKINLNNVMQMGTDADQNATGNFWISNSATGNLPFFISAADKVFIGGGTTAPSPTARLHLGAGTATANTGPLKFTSGTNLTTAENGTAEYDGSKLYFTPSGATRKVVVLAPTSPSAYTPTNVTTDRSYDANATTLDEIADVLGTLIGDLQATGIIG